MHVLITVSAISRVCGLPLLLSLTGRERVNMLVLPLFVAFSRLQILCLSFSVLPSTALLLCNFVFLVNECVFSLASALSLSFSLTLYFGLSLCLGRLCGPQINIHKCHPGTRVNTSRTDCCRCCCRWSPPKGLTSDMGRVVKEGGDGEKRGKEKKMKRKRKSVTHFKIQTMIRFALKRQAGKST